MHQIIYLKHHEINKEHWDNCISNSQQEMIYAYSWYLDIVSPNWDALITDRYEAVMPLTHKKKWGIQYLCTPPGVGQLGVFSAAEIDEYKMEQFIKAIPSFFKLIDIDFNFLNPTSLPFFQERANYTLSLNNDYNEIYKNYHRLAKRKLKTSRSSDLRLIKDFSPEVILKRAFETLHKKSKFPIEYVALLGNLANVAKEKGVGYAYGVVDKNGKLMASDLFFVGRKRLSSVIAGNDAAGNENGAFYMVLDQIIQDFSDTNLVLDFEGSDIEGIAFLFKNLGGQKETYLHYKTNNLPWPIKLLK